MTGDELEALTSFCVINPELEQLELLLGEFNIFEAAGLTRDEVKHSRFLAFLLDPRESHGLGDRFLTSALQAAVRRGSVSSSPVATLELELLDLNDMRVEVETHNIDILIRSDQHKIAVVIENKIGSGEHSNQLKRYWDHVTGLHPDWRVIAILLSPEGVKPSHDQFLALSYSEVADILQSLARQRASSLGAEIQIAICHYERLLRRNVVSDAKLEELCHQIIRKHAKALDLINSYRADFDSQVKKAAYDLVSNGEAFLTTSTRLFLPYSWLEWMPVSDDKSWTPTGHAMAFEFNITDKGLRLILNLGPGPREVAQAFLSTAVSAKHPFDTQSKSASKKWNILYRRVLVSPQTLKLRDTGLAVAELTESWYRATEIELPIMESRLRAAANLLCPAQDGSK